MVILVFESSDDVHQSVEQKVQLFIVGFLVCLLKPKIDHFQAPVQTLFKSIFLKKTLPRDLLTQELTPDEYRCKNIFFEGQSHYAPLYF